MSLEHPQTPLAKTLSDSRQITIVSHSTLFYWWPVWTVGFLLGLLSIFSPDLMAVVPKETKALEHAKVSDPVGEQSFENREVLVLPKDKHLHSRIDANDPKSPPANPRLHIASDKYFGVLFTTVLLLVIVITNIPLRGMWSFMVIFLVIALSIIFALAGWWSHIITAFNLLDIRINAGGYFYIASILFCIWLFTVLIFDKQIYMIFTPGQFKVCTEIGGGEQAFPTIGMTLEKQRSDLFRHWIIGLGSGDLIVKTTGAQAHHFEMPNVLFISSKMQKIEDMVRKIPD
ncbi:MAG: hypothetical protein ACYC3I_18355 [Gemmataceae bacterium]